MKKYLHFLPFLPSLPFFLLSPSFLIISFPPSFQTILINIFSEMPMTLNSPSFFTKCSLSPSLSSSSFFSSFLLSLTDTGQSAIFFGTKLEFGTNEASLNNPQFFARDDLHYPIAGSYSDAEFVDILVNFQEGGGGEMVGGGGQVEFTLGGIGNVSHYGDVIFFFHFILSIIFFIVSFHSHNNNLCKPNSLRPSPTRSKSRLFLFSEHKAP